MSPPVLSSNYDYDTLPPPSPADMPTTPAVVRAKNVVLASQGRGPWYTPDGKGVEAYVIGVAGGSGSGKVSAAERTMRWKYRDTRANNVDVGRAGDRQGAQPHPHRPHSEPGRVLQ
jgi:hypothetical protein